MKLTLPQVTAVALGVVRITEGNDGFHFFRFTREQEEIYLRRFQTDPIKKHEELYVQTFAASGVRLHFKTDSKALGLKASIFEGSYRRYFAFDILVNGKLHDCINTLSNTQPDPAGFCSGALLGGVAKEVRLGEGIKDVCIYLPWSVKAVIGEITLDDGAFIEAVKPDRRLLAFGDSITQGYDARHPSNKYVSRLADFLNAEEFNKGIGGERFFPELAAAKEDFIPDYITVSYGTNDWYWRDEGEFRFKCRRFYEALYESYRNVKIFAITPIWRKDRDEPRACGSFEKAGEIIMDAVKDIPQITCISGYDLVPHSEAFFADLTLHPNDEGFEHYFKNLKGRLLCLGLNI